MTGNDPCPRCGEDVMLVDPTEEVWGLDPAEFDEDAEVWICSGVFCGWHEEATIDESLDYHGDQLEWAMNRIAEIRNDRPTD